MRSKAALYIRNTLFALVAVVLLLFLWVQTGIGLNSIVERIVSRTGTLGEASLEIGLIRGNLFKSITAKDIKLIQNTDEEIIAIEEAQIQYALLNILRGSIHLPEIIITSPEVYLTQQEDGVWDITTLLKQEENPEKEDAAAQDIQINRLIISNINVTARCFSPEGDSTYKLETFFLDAENINVNENIGGALSNLNGVIHLPDRQDSVTLNLKASFQNQLFKLDEFRLRSLKSDLTGSGTIRLPWVDSLMHLNDFAIQARPLAFDDIRIFAPGLTPGQHMNLMMTVEGDSRSVSTTASVELSDGASLLAEGQLTVQEQQTYALDLEAVVKNLNPAFLDNASLPQANLNLNVASKLSGSALENISGTTEALLLQSSVENTPIDSTSLYVIWDEGHADVSLSSEFKEALLSLEGDVAPFASPLEYSFAGYAQNVNLASLLDSSYTGVISANWEIDGQGVSADEADIQSRISIGPSTYSLAKIQAGNVTASISKGIVDLDTELTTSQGSLQLSSLLSIRDEITLESLTSRLTNFNAASFAGDTTKNSISGTIAASAITGPELFARWVLDLEDIRYGPYLIKESQIEGRLENQRIQLSTENQLGEGTLNFRAMVNPFDEVLSYAIEGGVFSNLNVGFITQNESIASSLNGRFELSGSGSSPSTLQTSGAIEIQPSLFNDQQIDDGALTYSLSGDTLQTQIALATPGGGFRVNGSVTSLTQDPSYTLEQGEFGDINIGAFTGDSTLTTSLNGSFFLRGQGTTLNDLEVNSELNLRSGTINRSRINRGNASVVLDSGTGGLRSFIDLDDGSIDLNADIQSIDETIEFTYRASLDQLDAANLLGQDSLQAVINASMSGNGRDVNPREMYLTGTITSQESFYNEFDVDNALLAFTFNEGLLQIDTLTITSNVATVHGNGPVAIFDDEETLSSYFTAGISLKDLSPIAPLVQAELLNVSSGQLDMQMSGPPGVLQFDARLDLESLLYDEFRVGNLDGRISGEFRSDRTMGGVVIDGRVRTISIPGFVVDEILYNASLFENLVTFNIDTRIDSERNSQLQGSLTMEDESSLLELDRVTLKLDEDQWALKNPTRITLGNPIKIDNFYVTVDDESGAPSQLVQVNGIIDVEGSQDLALDIVNLEIGTISELLGLEGLDGKLNASASLEGAASAPNMYGQLDLNVISYGKEAGDIMVTMSYDSLRLYLDAAMQHVEGEELSISGYLPVDLTLAPPELSSTGRGISQNFEMGGEVDLDILSDSIRIGWLLPFIDPVLVDRLGGALAADFKVRGTASDPQLSGEGRLFGGVLRSPQIGTTLEAIEAELALRDNAIYINNTRAQSGEGVVSVDGQIRLDDLANAELDLDIQAREFLAIDTREYRSTLSGDLAFTGTVAAPVLTGTIRLISTDVFFENSGSQELADLNVALTEADLLMLEREFGIRPTASDTSTTDFYAALTMDIDIELERDTWIRSKTNPEMNVQFDGELDLIKQPFADQEVYGSIDVNPDRSYITQFGKRFEINQGNIVFNGPITDLILDFEARYEVPSRRSQDNAVTVYMDIDGSMDRLDLTLRSDPTMELTDIVAYVVTGQPASEAFQLGGATNQTAGDLALNSGVGLLSGALESLVQESGLELDVIQIEPSNDARGATVTAGKYVTPRLFTAVSQPIGASNLDGSTDEFGTVVTIELELVDSLLLRLLGGESVMQINLLWHRAY